MIEFFTDGIPQAPQGLRLRKLAKAHRHELVPATEAFRPRLRTGAFHRRSELGSIDQI